MLQKHISFSTFERSASEENEWKWNSKYLESKREKLIRSRDFQFLVFSSNGYSRTKMEFKLRKIMHPFLKCSIFPVEIFSWYHISAYLFLGRHSDNLVTSRMTLCSKNIGTVPLFYCNFDSISFCVLTTSVLIRDCNLKTTSTFLSVVSFKVYSTKNSSSQESDDKYM